MLNKLKTFMNGVSFFGTLSAYLIFSFLLLIIGDNLLFYQLILGLIISYLIVGAIRFLYYKERPVAKPYKNIFQKIDSSSFPSLHCTKITILFLLISNSYRNFLIISLLFSLAFLVCFSRYYLRKHYIFDIIFGAIIGIIISFFLIFLVKLI